MTDTVTDQTVPRLNRPLNGLVSGFAILLTFGSIAWAADWYNAVGLVLYNEQFLAGMLGLVLALAFLSVPMRKNGQGRLPWYFKAEYHKICSRSRQSVRQIHYLKGN